MDEAQKAELEELVEELEKIKGRHTELVSVYVPAGYNVNSVQKQLEAEKSTAKNIKSTATRKNVIDALEKIVRYLKGLKKTPENGLAIFCGNISKVEGQQDLQLWNIEPPMPLKMRLYRCDKEFVLDALREMLEAREVFGLLVMDRKEATIGMLEGKRIETLQKMTSGVPSKVRAGGQCLSPDILVETVNGIKKIKEIDVGDKLKALDINKNKIIFAKCLNKWEVIKPSYRKVITKEGIEIICSIDHIFLTIKKRNIGNTIAESLSHNSILINSNLNETKIYKLIDRIKNIKMIDIETEAKNFFANSILVHNSSQRFHRITEGLTREFYKRIAEEMKKIFFDMKNLKGILVGGPVPTKDEFLEQGYLITRLKEKVIGVRDIGDADEHGLKLLVGASKDTLAEQEITQEKKLLDGFFEVLGENPDKAAYGYKKVKRALEMGAVDTLILSKKVKKEIIEELNKLAKQISSKVEVVSTDTGEGEQFYNLSGIGAILRFKIN